jgi:hypothetical protein
LALFLVQNCPPEAAAASAASSRAALMEQRAGTNSWRVVDKMRDDTSLLGPYFLLIDKSRVSDPH